jgi:iron complex outermembrane receptor protein
MIPAAARPRRPLARSARGFALVVSGALAFASRAPAQVPDSVSSPGALKRLTLEQLMAVEVSSVSRRPEPLSETASAIQVITREAIRRSGATRLPEALRLATNLEVAQLNSSQWAISARGFNSNLANKMLVMIDGRTVYSPLFGGVFWEVQDVLLEDVERIEVISGPGAAAWGANAVNGVINITTRSAKDTHGLLAVAGGGTELHGLGGVRYGGAIGATAHLRVYAKYSDRDGGELPSGEDVSNDWDMGQGGFRLDWDPTSEDAVTLQGDLYRFRTDLPATSDAVLRGSNVIGRWSRRLSGHSDLQVQAYFDRAHRDVPLPGSYDDVLNTYDIDAQHRIGLGRHDVVWGLGYRRVEDDFGPGGLVLVPRQVSLETFGGFAQDEIAVRERLHLTVGAKLEHNDYTGFEFQPSVRLAWQATTRQTLWAAVSRAVRTPSRLDRDFTALPGGNFQSEKLLAYELGYRIQPAERLSLSLATFYNDYDDIRSIEVSAAGPAPVFLANGQEAESYGFELVARFRPREWWRLRAGWSELRVDIDPKPGSTDQTFGSAEAADAKRQLSLRSAVDLPARLELDAWLRYVSAITNPIVPTPGYSELDLRLGWSPVDRLELSIAGQNLLHARHLEFGSAANGQAVQRGVFAKATWGF